MFFLSVQGIVGSILEVFATTVFVYLVLPEIPSGIGILLLCGVFSFQTLVDIRNQNRHQMKPTKQKRTKGGYLRIQDSDTGDQDQSDLVDSYKCSVMYFILEDRIVKILALLIQFIGIVGFSMSWGLKSKEYTYDFIVQPVIGYPLVAFVLSVLWSNFFQTVIAKPNQEHEPKPMDSEEEGEHEHKPKIQENEIIGARFKSSKYMI